MWIESNLTKTLFKPFNFLPLLAVAKFIHSILYARMAQNPIPRGIPFTDGSVFDTPTWYNDPSGQPG